MLSLRIGICALFILFVSVGKGQSQIFVGTSSPCSKNILTGYTNRTSYLPGDNMLVYLDASTSLNCDLGIYNTFGALLFQAKAILFPQTKKADKPWEKGFGYKVSAII